MMMGLKLRLMIDTGGRQPATNQTPILNEKYGSSWYLAPLCFSHPKPGRYEKSERRYQVDEVAKQREKGLGRRTSQTDAETTAKTNVFSDLSS